jgi:hypothetical protein
MFVDFSYRVSEKRSSNNWLYLITDDNFSEFIDIENLSNIGPELIVAVINIYENKQLPVAINIVKAILCFNKKYNWDIKQTLPVIRSQTPGFNKYEKDIEKYLLLL